MATKINYNNKAPFQTREDIPNENKANAEDMNEIKEVVNNNADELDAAKENIESLQNGQGTSNADITSLKNRVTTLEGDNTTNKADISSLKTDNETNKSNIEELQQDNETNKTNITNLQNNKVDKVEGKGLSTEDFTTELKTKLEGLENYNDAEIKQDIAELEEKVSTLEEDNTTNKTNIEALQEDNTQNKVDISDLQESQEEQNSDIEALTNALPTETQEDENINIKGTIPVKFKEFVVKGNSKQETRSGKNLVNIPDTFTFTSYELVNVEITSGTYKVSFKQEEHEGENFPYVRFKDNNKWLKLDKSLGEQEIVLDTNEAGLQFYSNGSSASASQGLSATIEEFMISKDGGEYEQYGASPSPEYPSAIQNVEGDVNVTVANKEKTEQQTVTFPLSQGQKLMLGDYLADDGIHHKRKQIELDGTENWQKRSNTNNTFQFIISETSQNGICNNYKSIKSSQIDKEDGIYLLYTNAIIITDFRFTTVADFKNHLSTKKEANEPVVIEYEPTEEEIEAYTEEQQEAYNQICNLKAYEEETNIFSTNETSPIFKVTAVKDVNSVITQLNQLILENGGN